MVPATRWLSLALLVTQLGAASGESGPRTFSAAIALEADHRYAEAARALEELGRSRSTEALADDALFEAAVIAEEHLDDPVRAAALYQEVVSRFPHSRLARRAAGRVTFLRDSLRTGAAPFREYQDILSRAAQRSTDQSIARMEELLRRYPDFALADRSLYWLADAYANQHRYVEAESRLRELEQRFPGGEWALRAMKARADLALVRHRPLEARTIFSQLAHQPNPLARSLSAEGLAATRSDLIQIGVAWLAIAYLAGFVLLHLRALRKHRSPLTAPVELLYYAPIALLFLAAAVTEHAAIARATATLAGGGALIIWLGGALTKRYQEAGILSRGRRLRFGAFIALAVLALFVVAVQLNGLTPLVVETLRNGPER